MTPISTLCQKLNAIPGVKGAFVLHREHCIASSLPQDCDLERLAKVGLTLERMRAVVQKAGYDGSSTAFHWESVSLLTWPSNEGTLLGLVATPEAERNTLEWQAAEFLVELARLLPRRVLAQEIPTRPEQMRPRRA